jgi:hypothetical protein
VKDNQSEQRIKTRIGVILVVVGLLVGMLGGLAIGYYVLGQKNNDNKPAPSKIESAKVCTDSDVDKYNKLLDQEPLKDFIGQIDAFYEELKGRADVNQDATCQYMLYSIALLRTNADKDQYINNLKELNGKGEYPNNKLYNLMGVNSLM